MLSPNATPTPITPPRVPLVDPRTGLIDRAWYMFFVSLINAATLVYDGDLGPSPESLISSYDAALQALAQNVETQPLPVDLSAELTKQIEAAGLANYTTGLLSQIAEMQKQLDALNLLPTPTQGTVIEVTGTAPVVSTGGISPNISMAAANTSTDGYLTSTDWNTFNNKAPATSGVSILYGNGSGGFSNVSTGSGISFVAGVLSATGSGGTITSVTATAPIASSGGFTPNISINAAYGDTVNPYAAKTANYVLAGPTSGAAAVPAFRALVAADIPSLPYGSGTVTSVAALTLGTTGTDLTSTVANGTTTPVITLNVPTASATNRGALSSTDWTTFNNKGSGTVTSVTGTSPVVSSGGTTPAISMPAATTSVSGYLTSTDWNTFNGKQPAGTYVTSVTGTAPVVSSGGTTPAISMAAASTSVSGYLTSTDWNTFNGKGSGTVTSVSFTGGIITVATGTTTPAFTVAGTSGGIPYFASGTTWASSAALTQYGIVYGGGAGAAPVATAAGTTGQVLTATTGGAPTWAAPATSGTVTTVSVVSANGFAGTVATDTTTPAITLTTSITGLLKGNGTAISAAVANIDYVPLSTVLTKTADYTITGTDTWIINNKTGSALTLTFPAASSWTGRYITVKNMQAQLVNSASSNIVPIDSTTAGTAILLAVVGNWATMVSDGTNWVIMQAASNNNLLLE